jgi:hypothetical protein
MNMVYLQVTEVLEAFFGLFHNDFVTLLCAQLHVVLTSPFPNHPWIRLSTRCPFDTYATGKKNTDLDAVPSDDIYIHKLILRTRPARQRTKPLKPRSPDVRHDRVCEVFPPGQIFRAFEDADVELRDGRLDAGQGRVVEKARVKDGFAFVRGGIIDERVELADHLGVGRRRLPRSALRERAPDWLRRAAVMPNVSEVRREQSQRERRGNGR